MVRLDRLAVEGLFSYTERQEAVFSGRTVIVGPNNAGKSNLFRAVSVLADALLHDRKLPASRISQSGGSPSIEAEISLSSDEIETLADFLSCGYNDDNSAIQKISMLNIAKIKNYLDSITIKIEWEKMPNGSGDNPDVEMQFPKLGFVLNGMLNEKFFRAIPMDKDLSIERQPVLAGVENFALPATRHADISEIFLDRQNSSVQLNAFLKEILQNDDPNNASKKFLRAKGAVHDPIQFQKKRLDPKSRSKIQNLMHRLDIRDDTTVSLLYVIGTTLAKRTVHATENRNLLQGDVNETFESLASSTADSDGFGRRYNSALLDMLAHNSLKHADTLENDGSNIAQLLFSLKNSPKRSDVERYYTIKNKFRHLFRDQRLDIEPVLEYPVVDSHGDGSLRFPKPRLAIVRKGLPEHLPLEQVGAGARGLSTCWQQSTAPEILL